MRRYVAALMIAALIPGPAGCGWFGSSDQTKATIKAAKGGSLTSDDGVRVAFPSGALSRDTEVRVAPVAKPAATVLGTSIAGPVVDVGIGTAELRSYAEITFPLKTPAGPEDHVFVATWADDGTWTSAGGTVAADGRSVTARVPHFSPWTAVKALKPATKVLESVEALRTAYADVTFRAKTPDCAPASQIWSSSTKGNAVKVCAFTGDATHPSRLRVVNNRAYPQFIQLLGYPPMESVRTYPGSPSTVEQVFRKLAEVNANYTFLPGKGETTLALPPNFRHLDIVSRPGVEAVIAQVIIDVVSVALPLVDGLAKAVQCALDAKVVREIIDERAFSRIPDLASPLVNCVSAAFTAGEMFPVGFGGAPPPEEKKQRDRLVNAIISAVKDLPVAGLTVIQGAMQGPAGQHILATRQPVVPQRAVNEDRALPAAVLATQRRLAAAAERWDDDRYAVAAEVPPAGLRFGNAADPNQKPSLVLGQEPDPIAGPQAADMLYALMMVPPQRAVCDEIGQTAYVYGRAVPDPRQLSPLGFNEETSALIRSAARLAKDYRACLLDDGTWAVFSRAVPIGTFPSGEATKLPPTEPGEESPALNCARHPSSAFVPPDAGCLTVTDADVDGDRRPDKLLMYGREGGWTARALLARGAVRDLALPSGDLPPDAHPYIVGQADFDGDGGTEVAIVVGGGARSEEVVLLTFAGDALTLVRRTSPPPFTEPDRFTLDEALTNSAGLGCADVTGDGRLEFVEGSAGFERDLNGRLTAISTGQTISSWRGKTLTPLRKTTGTLPASREAVTKRPPYRGVGCP